MSENTRFFSRRRPFRTTPLIHWHPLLRHDIDLHLSVVSKSLLRVLRSIKDLVRTIASAERDLLLEQESPGAAVQIGDERSIPRWLIARLAPCPFNLARGFEPFGVCV